MDIKIKKLHKDAEIPTYAHGPAEDAGMDVKAIENVTLIPGQPKAVATGLSVEIPTGYEMQVRPRSGLALTKAITVLNAPGTIDPGYRGEVKVILLNAGHVPVYLIKGDKIAQLVVAKYEAVKFVEASDLAESARGENGFGSTDKKAEPAKPAAPAPTPAPAPAAPKPVAAPAPKPVTPVVTEASRGPQDGHGTNVGK